METLSAAFGGEIGREYYNYYNEIFCILKFCISNKRLFSMQGTYFQNASLKSKLLTKNPFLPLGGQEK